jgi:phage-related tail protein
MQCISDRYISGKSYIIDMDQITKDKFIKVKNIQKLEKDMRRANKQLRRLQSKVQKATANYNRVLKSYEDGQTLIKIMGRKRDELLLEFKELGN